jgi:hypothetical protein
VAGEHKGQQLEALPAILSYREVWLKFHPRSAMGGAPPK